MAILAGRRFVGIEISPEYLDIADGRIGGHVADEDELEIVSLALNDNTRNALLWFAIAV